MILVTTEFISGKELETLGLVKGSAIHTVNMFKDMAEMIKSLVGGELNGYVKMMDEARALATKRMVTEAEAHGADAIVGVGYAASSIMQHASEVIVYGTAVKFK